ncbi:hypothetical protein [Ferruginibacter albus]|uniref:hypothetical protein n=1 Tax=Ferruginibacter albus TaxID=2875540 RepID=UPI001CC6610D|nr:hypothetical protein [Ferruginibacter albus]UAY50771.1 hypothetical protein K9M53_09220 [Ferruginibacter albus]
MKRIFFLLLPVVIFYSCSKNDGGGNTPPPPTDTTTTNSYVKKAVIHPLGISSGDTLQFSYDAQKRLTQYALSGVDSASNPYLIQYSFIYTGNNTYPDKYIGADNSGNTIIDILTCDQSGRVIKDSAIGDITTNINYSSNVITATYTYQGQALQVDSLIFNQSSNINQWAIDTAQDNGNYSRVELISYDSYSTFDNPFANLKTLAPVLYKITSLSDPSLWYSQKLPGTTSDSQGGQSHFTYVSDGSKIIQIKLTDDVGGSTIAVDLSY